MKISLKEQLYNFLQEKGRWVNTSEIESYAKGINYLASNATRRCRELHQQGLLNVRYNNYGVAEYCITQQDLSTEQKEFLKKSFNEVGGCATMFLLEAKAKDKSLLILAKNYLQQLETLYI